MNGDNSSQSPAEEPGETKVTGTEDASSELGTTSGVFVASDTGLRDIAVDHDQPQWFRVLRFVPLVLLICAVVAATVIGLWYRSSHEGMDGLSQGQSEAIVESISLSTPWA